jgi:hypothetical protein
MACLRYYLETEEHHNHTWATWCSGKDLNRAPPNESTDLFSSWFFNDAFSNKAIGLSR